MVSIKDLEDGSMWGELKKKLPWTIRYLRMSDELAKEYSIKYGVNIVLHRGYHDWLECGDRAHFTADRGISEGEKFELIKKHVIAYTEYSREIDRRWEKFKEEKEKATR